MFEYLLYAAVEIQPNKNRSCVRVEGLGVIFFLLQCQTLCNVRL